MALKTLQTSNLDNPAEHFSWALRNVPGVGTGPSGTSLPAAWADAISTHLSEIGFVWAPYLAAKANADGYIHVSDLPQQTKKFLRPQRGDQSHFNPGCQWVPMDTPEPEVITLPDPDHLTPQERDAMVAMWRAKGYISDPEPPPNYARVV